MAVEPKTVCIQTWVFNIFATLHPKVDFHTYGVFGHRRQNACLRLLLYLRCAEM